MPTQHEPTLTETDEEEAQTMDHGDGDDPRVGQNTEQLAFVDATAYAHHQTQELQQVSQKQLQEIAARAHQLEHDEKHASDMAEDKGMCHRYSISIPLRS